MDRYQLEESGRLIATGTIEEIVSSMEEMHMLTPNIGKMRESLHLSDEYFFGGGLYEMKKISNPK